MREWKKRRRERQKRREAETSTAARFCSRARALLNQLGALVVCFRPCLGSRVTTQNSFLDTSLYTRSRRHTHRTRGGGVVRIITARASETR